MTTYSVTYYTPSDVDESHATAIENLPGEGDLESVRANCRALDCRAQLRDEQGYQRGWVSQDGGYTLA